MRCPDCNKFVPMATDNEPEANGDVSGTSYTCEIRLAHTCEECGTELRECNLEVSYDFADDLPTDVVFVGGTQQKMVVKPCSPDPDSESEEPMEHAFDLDGEEYSLTEKPVIGARGKALKGRFTHGVEGNVTVRCSNCDMTVEFYVEHDGEEASSFEECC
jgi:hypothetical protein